MHQTPSIDTFRLMGDSEQMMVVSGSPKDVPVCEGSLVMNLQNNALGGVSNCENSLVFGFDDSACLSTNMATTTMQEVETTRELAQRDVRMYPPRMYVGIRSEVGRDGSDGPLSGSGSHLSGGLGQLYQRRGPYCGPLNEPPGGGGMPGGGGGDPDPGPPPQGRLPCPLVNGSLKGTAPAIFDGNRRNMKQFTQEFTLYWMINQDMPTM